MAKFIFIGAVLGSIIGWIMNFSILIGLVLGAGVGWIIFTINLKTNTPPIKETNEPAEPKIQLREEQLDIKKQRVQTGEVTIHKEIVEEQKTFTIPIRREEMVIEAGSEEELRIPLKEEEVEISKHPVKVNEVSISKQQIDEIQHVKETVKRETADIEIKGEADLKEDEKQL